MILPGRVFLLTLVLSGGAGLFAQSGEEIERLLGQPAVCWGDLSLWTFSSAGLPYSEHDAAYYAAKFKAMPAGVSVDNFADLAGAALLIMRAHNIKGGLFYSLLHTRRYAFRELLYLGLFNREDAPEDTLSGERFLRILSAARALGGGGK